MKFFSLFGDRLIHQMANVFGLIPANRIEDADVIFFPGGPDVHPSFYGETPHPRTYADMRKNEEEQRVYDRFADRFKVGICGGGQILNVLNGGRMFQDSDHPGRHPLTVRLPDGKERLWQVNSTHHQLMRVGPKACLWGWTDIASHRDTIDGPPSTKDEHDNEIIWYPETKTLCFQPHPEYGHGSTTQLFHNCLEQIGVL